MTLKMAFVAESKIIHGENYAYEVKYGANGYTFVYTITQEMVTCINTLIMWNVSV